MCMFFQGCGQLECRRVCPHFKFIWINGQSLLMEFQCCWPSGKHSGSCEKDEVKMRK